MEKTTVYLGVESIRYEFSEYEVKEALCKKHHIPLGMAETTMEIWLDEDGSLAVAITQKIYKEKDKNKDTGNA